MAMRQDQLGMTAFCSIAQSQLPVADPGNVLWALKNTPFCSLDNRKWVWFFLKVGVFQGKSMKKNPPAPCESSGSTPEAPINVGKFAKQNEATSIIVGQISESMTI